MRFILLTHALLALCVGICTAQDDNDAQTAGIALNPDIFLIEERMPIWHSCDSSHFNRQDAQVCTREKFAEYVYEHFKLPKRAEKKKLSGKVVVSFTVEKNRQIDDVKILRDIGGGCGRALKKVAESMPAWMPAIQHGEYVSVRFNFPLKIGFDLNN